MYTSGGIVQQLASTDLEVRFFKVITAACLSVQVVMAAMAHAVRKLSPVSGFGYLQQMSSRCVVSDIFDSDVISTTCRTRKNGSSIVD